MHRCNGCGDCDNCHNKHCIEWVECDVCCEKITEDYFSIDNNDYHKDCFAEQYEVKQ